ncbi:MAG: protein kinase [Clostridium sp.]|nr:protein kinase [Clostridium sp.]MCM1399136.1 protein kinase [Clostridium sp.]MCM1459528.1 protein kinase [Bacteroides sp.]
MQTRYDRCPNCMQAIQENEDTCSYCGFDINGYEERSNCLKPFTVLENKYMLGRVIGVGGFGITYIGWDLNLQTYIAIKEYFPDSIAGRDASRSEEVIPNEGSREIYDKGLKRYVEEAQNISRFYQLQGIVSVKDFFYANGTAYIVMEYINGINLKEYLKNCGGRLDEATVLALMKPVFESMYQIHNSGLVHRDISPDNIMVDTEGKIKLIDFGSARGQSAESDKTYTVILKHGYAPSEQYYAKGNQGPWTDIYSLCATMYKMLTGMVPPNSVERMEQDMYQSPSSMGIPVSQRTASVLAKGLAVKINDRYQNIGQLLTDLYGEAPVVQAGSSIPIASAAAQANSMSLSKQSMHISGPVGASTKGKDNRKTGYIVISALAAVVLVAVLAIVLGGGGDKKKKETTESQPVASSGDSGTGEKTDDTTETTTEKDTEGSTEEGGYVYQSPKELSDNWRDYQFRVNDTMYQLPVPYADWIAAGWKADRIPTTLAAGADDTVQFHMDGVQLYATIANFGLSELDISDCFIIGIRIEIEDISENMEFELPAGIMLGKASEADIKVSYGAPEYRFEDEDDGAVRLDYAGDSWDDGMDLKVDADGKLSSIRMANIAVPEGLESEPSQISTDAPGINDLYKAPEGPSTDRFDAIITLDGVNYQLPVPASVLAENGWILDTATEEYLLGEDMTTTYMEKNGSRIEVKLYNYTQNAILPINAYVVQIGVEAGYIDLDVVFPGGLKLGGDASEFGKLYGDLGDDYFVSEYSTATYEHAYYYYNTKTFEYVLMSIRSNPETGKIESIDCENKPNSVN